MSKQGNKDIASFAIEKAHSIECPLLTGCTINSVPMEELAKMTRWFSFISKDMAKELHESGRNLDNRKLGLYFQYCIDKAAEITYLAICGADWTDVEYCADEHISVTDAIRRVYSSNMYKELEQEQTKRWHEGPVSLYQTI